MTVVQISPRDFKKTVIDNPIEMDTSPLGAALGESVRNFPFPFFFSSAIPELLVRLRGGLYNTVKECVIVLQSEIFGTIVTAGYDTWFQDNFIRKI